MASKLRRLVILGVVTAVGSWYATLQVFGQRAEGPMEVPPLSYDTVEQQIDQNGNVVVETYTKHAVRRDGSTVRIMNYREADGTPTEMRQITDVSQGNDMWVNSGLEIVTTYLFESSAADWIRSQLQCARDSAAPRSTILGHEVVLETIASPIGTQQAEIWWAPALGCIALVETHTRVEDGMRLVRHVENLRLGEPDETLFMVPSSYEEASPAEASRLAGERFGSTVLGADHPGMLRLEERYAQSRRQ